MLTDKTKEAFEEWYYKLINSQEYKAKDFYYDMDFLPFSMQYGIYIDFFDENEIYIDAHRTIKGYSVMIQYGKEMEFIELDKDYKTRSEARKNAILKANNIFNETN